MVSSPSAPEEEFLVIPPSVARLPPPSAGSTPRYGGLFRGGIHQERRRRPQIELLSVFSVHFPTQETALFSENSASDG